MTKQRTYKRKQKGGWFGFGETNSQSWTDYFSSWGNKAKQTTTDVFNSANSTVENITNTVYNSDNIGTQTPPQTSIGGRYKKHYKTIKGGHKRFRKSRKRIHK